LAEPVSDAYRIHEEIEMSARTKSKVTPKYKTKYRMQNWATYEESLRRRGDITIWFDSAVVRYTSSSTRRV